MPNILSKICQQEWSFPYNCYEMAHTWTPNCTEGSLDLALIVFKNGLKMYSGLYVVNCVFNPIQCYDIKPLS